MSHLKDKSRGRQDRKIAHKCEREGRKRTTITSGPLIIPERVFLVTPGIFIGATFTRSTSIDNFRVTIYIVLKNPTDRWLSATVSIGEADFPPDTQSTTEPVPTVIKSEDITELEKHFGSITVAPRSVRLISFLPRNGTLISANRVVRVTATGDFAVSNDRPKCGLLEMEVLGGLSQQTFDAVKPAPMNNPIIFGTNLLEVKFADFAVCASARKHKSKPKERQ